MRLTVYHRHFLAYGIKRKPWPSAGWRCEGVASRLRETRTARGLTMRTRSGRWFDRYRRPQHPETGTSMPSIATVESLAVALGVSPAWLAYGLGPMELPNRRRKATTPEPDHDLTA